MWADCGARAPGPDTETRTRPRFQLSQLRLLEVNNRVILPSTTHLRILVTGAGVLHS